MCSPTHTESLIVSHFSLLYYDQPAANRLHLGDKLEKLKFYTLPQMFCNFLKIFYRMCRLYVRKSEHGFQPQDSSDKFACISCKQLAAGLSVLCNCWQVMLYEVHYEAVYGCMVVN